MTVEYVPNDDESDSSESDESSDEEDTDEEIQPGQEEEAVMAQIEALNRRLADTGEEMQKTKYQLDVLEQYGRSFKSEESEPKKVTEYLQTYSQERNRMYQVYKTCVTETSEIKKEIKEKSKEVAKLKKIRDLAAKKALEEKSKESRKKAKIKADQAAKKRAAKEQRWAFWPKKVYQVILSIEPSSDSSSSINRRSSLELRKSPSSDQKSKVEDASALSLTFSYVTLEASWWPAYDLQLTTPSRTGTLAYRAEFKNTTSEAWRNAKIVLSTSQTSFSGFTKLVPTLAPWHVRLSKRAATSRSSSNQATWDNAWNGALESQYEREERRKLKAPLSRTYRNDMFGNKAKPWYRNDRGLASTTNNAHSNLFQAPNQWNQSQLNAPPAPQQSSLFGSNAGTAPTGAFGQSQGFGSSADMGLRRRVESDEIDSDIARELADSSNMGLPDDDDSSVLSADTVTGALAFQESSREDYGLTTTYSIPTNRTLVPSFLTRRHNIAEVSLSSITLSYIVIPKLRPAAFLKASIRNSSGMTLLRGRANLTLDGTFLGNTFIPRASPDETFTLTLGIDPAIHVSYAKPTVHRSSSGVFNKEESVVYTRVISITNTKSQKEPVELLVLDQVPVSEDELLKLTILSPVGLKNEGDRARAGQGIKSGNWGKAVATLKKHGEVSWNVTLNPAAAVKLVLEYATKFPASDAIVGIN